MVPNRAKHHKCILHTFINRHSHFPTNFQVQSKLSSLFYANIVTFCLSHLKEVEKNSDSQRNIEKTVTEMSKKESDKLNKIQKI